MIMRLEYQALLDVLGVDEQEAGRMGFPRYEIEDVIKEVEGEMKGNCGWNGSPAPDSAFRSPRRRPVQTRQDVIVFVATCFGC